MAMEAEADWFLDGIDFFDVDDFHLDSSFLLAPLPVADAESPVSVTSDPNLNPVNHEGTPLSEIERVLMEDGESDGGAGLGFDADGFFDAVFASDGDDRGDVGGGSPNQTTGSSEVVGPTDVSDGDGSKEKAEEVVVVEPLVVDVNADVDEEEINGDDPISKKKRRQIRNRDSAMKSRERKKTYVKDLELKAKYLEVEVRRLNHALQCYAAENIALRQSLQKERPIVANAAMQESAVLSETLPLVSLYWLVSIVCLFLMPVLSSQNPKSPSRLGRELEMAPGKTASDEPKLRELILQRRSCKGMKTRMKFSSFPLHVVAAT